MARRGLALDLSETGYVWRQKSESLLGTQSSWKRLLEKPMSVGRHLGDALSWKVLDPEWKHCFRGDASGTFAQSCGILDLKRGFFLQLRCALTSTRRQVSCKWRPSTAELLESFARLVREDL